MTVGIWGGDLVLMSNYDGCKSYDGIVSAIHNSQEAILCVTAQILGVEAHMSTDRMMMNKRGKMVESLLQTMRVIHFVRLTPTE